MDSLIRIKCSWYQILWQQCQKIDISVVMVFMVNQLIFLNQVLKFISILSFSLLYIRQNNENDWNVKELKTWNE